MPSVNFNLRGITAEMMGLLKKEAKKQHVSVNLLIIKIIEQGMGYRPQAKRLVYHDLDTLAGNWSAEEAKAFKNNTKIFEKIDKELWS